MERSKKRNEDQSNKTNNAKAERIEELMLEIEKQKLIIEKYQKIENQVEDNIDWDAPETTEPRTGKNFHSVCIRLFLGKFIEIKGEWKGSTAGGCINHLSWRRNPQIFLHVPKNTNCTFTIYQPHSEDNKKEISFYVFKTSSPESTYIIW